MTLAVIGCASGGTRPATPVEERAVLPHLSAEDREFLVSPLEGYPRTLAPDVADRLLEAHLALVTRADAEAARRTAAELLAADREMAGARLLAAQADFAAGEVEQSFAVVGVPCARKGERLVVLHTLDEARLPAVVAALSPIPLEQYLALRAPNDTWNGFYDDYVPPLIINGLIDLFFVHVIRVLADLVEDRRRALISRRIDHVAFECGNRLQFILSSDQTELAAAVGCCDGGSFRQVNGREARLNETSGRRVESIEEPCVRDKSVAQLRERRSRRVAKDQRIVVWLRVKEVAAVRSPARHLLDRVLPEVRQRTQSSRHLPELRVLLSLRVEEIRRVRELGKPRIHDVQVFLRRVGRFHPVLRGYPAP